MGLTDDVGFCDVLDFALSRVCERMVSMPSRVKTRCALFCLPGEGGEVVD